jgi:hypothetical protein
MSAVDPERQYAAIRTALIGYGIAAYSYLVARPGPPNEPQALGLGGSVSSCMLAGLGLGIWILLVLCASPGAVTEEVSTCVLREVSLR